MLSDLMIAGARIPGIGPMVVRSYEKHLNSRWVNKLSRMANDIESVIPKESFFILVDEAKLESKIFARWCTIPFLEKNGLYWGSPSDDHTAISELERLRKAGANFIVFGWPAFWWLDHYTELNHYLRERYRCVLQNDRLIVFDLTSTNRGFSVG